MIKISKKELLEKTDSISMFTGHDLEIIEIIVPKRNAEKKQGNNLYSFKKEDKINYLSKQFIKNNNERFINLERILNNEKKIIPKLKAAFHSHFTKDFKKKYDEIIKDTKERLIKLKEYNKLNEEEIKNLIQVTSIPDTISVNDFIEKGKCVFVIKLYIDYNEIKPTLKYDVKQEIVKNHSIYDNYGKNEKFDYIVANIIEGEHFCIVDGDDRYEHYDKNIIKLKGNNRFIALTKEAADKLIESI